MWAISKAHLIDIISRQKTTASANTYFGIIPMTASKQQSILPDTKPRSLATEKKRESWCIVLIKPAKKEIRMPLLIRVVQNKHSL